MTSKTCADPAEPRVTEAQRAEWLGAIAQHTQDAIVGRDLHGCITFWNTAATRIFGYSPDEAVGQKFADLLPALNPTDDQNLARAQTGEYDHVRLAKGKKPIGVGLTIAPVHGRDGLSLGTALVIRDVTERRRVDVELAQSDVIAAIGTLSACTVRALSGPIDQALQGVTRAESACIETATAEATAEILASARESLDDAVRALSYLRAIVDSDGDYATPIELARVLETAIRWSAVTLRTGPCVQAEFASTALVRADPAPLSQAFVHLLDHAADAVSTKLPVAERTITLRVYNASPKEVAVEISHNGSAASEKERAHMFDFFFTDQPIEDRIRRGLASARRVVETLGGSIKVVGHAREPTTFRVQLPCDVSSYTPTDPTPAI